MSNYQLKYKVLKPAPDAGFNAMYPGKTPAQNVLPMFYPKNKNPRKLLICKGFRYITVGPPGLGQFFHTLPLNTGLCHG